MHARAHLCNVHAGAHLCNVRQEAHLCKRHTSAASLRRLQKESRNVRERVRGGVWMDGRYGRSDMDR